MLGSIGLFAFGIWICAKLSGDTSEEAGESYRRFGLGMEKYISQLEVSAENKKTLHNSQKTVVEVKNNKHEPLNATAPPIPQPPQYDMNSGETEIIKTRRVARNLYQAGVDCVEGNNVQKNFKIAHKRFQRAAELGHHLAKQVLSKIERGAKVSQLDQVLKDLQHNHFFCNDCGGQLNVNEHFCIICGAKISKPNQVITNDTPSGQVQITPSSDNTSAIKIMASTNTLSDKIWSYSSKKGVLRNNKTGQEYSDSHFRRVTTSFPMGFEFVNRSDVVWVNDMDVDFS